MTRLAQAGRVLGAAFYNAERLLSRMPGFFAGYAAADERWSDALDRRVAANRTAGLSSQDLFDAMEKHHDAQGR